MSNEKTKLLNTGENGIEGLTFSDDDEKSLNGHEVQINSTDDDYQLTPSDQQLLQNKNSAVIDMLNQRGDFAVPFEFLLAGIVSGYVFEAFSSQYNPPEQGWDMYENGAFWAGDAVRSVSAIATFLSCELAMAIWKNATLRNQFQKLVATEIKDNADLIQALNTTNFRKKNGLFIEDNWAEVAKGFSKFFIAGNTIFLSFAPLNSLVSNATDNLWAQAGWGSLLGVAGGLTLHGYSHLLSMHGLRNSLKIQTAMGLIGTAEGLVIGKFIIDAYNIQDEDTQANILFWASTIGGMVGALLLPVSMLFKSKPAPVAATELQNNVSSHEIEKAQPVADARPQSTGGLASLWTRVKSWSPSDLFSLPCLKARSKPSQEQVEPTATNGAGYQPML